MKSVLITGIFGQDGSYLCEMLLSKGYEVHGIVRQPLSANSTAIQAHLKSKAVLPILHYCDLSDYDKILSILIFVRPVEVYHLAARNLSSERSTPESDQALYKANLLATFNLITALRESVPDARLLLAGSCLMFDRCASSPQDSRTPFETGSFYGLAKVSESLMAKFFRAQGMHVSMAIFYNHESPRRSLNFVTKKIVNNFVQVTKGKQNSFSLGNVDNVKDWGYAKDYVNGMWLMGQQEIPRDFVLATGRPKTIRHFVETVARELDIVDWRHYVKIDPEVVTRDLGVTLVGDPTEAEEMLGWNHSVSFEGLVSLMVSNELEGSLD